MFSCLGNGTKREPLGGSLHWHFTNWSWVKAKDKENTGDWWRGLAVAGWCRLPSSWLPQCDIEAGGVISVRRYSQVLKAEDPEPTWASRMQFGVNRVFLVEPRGSVSCHQGKGQGCAAGKVQESCGELGELKKGPALWDAPNYPYSLLAWWFRNWQPDSKIYWKHAGHRIVQHSVKKKGWRTETSWFQDLLKLTVIKTVSPPEACMWMFIIGRNWRQLSIH